MNITSPVTGLALTGLTSPTFTVASDTAPSPNGKQWYVSALGGTQDGVDGHSIGRPFTISLFRPAIARVASAALATIAGFVANAPRNTNKVITRKSVKINSLGGYSLMTITTTFEVPVGAPENDLVSIKSAISAHGGAVIQSPDQWPTAIESGAL